MANHGFVSSKKHFKKEQVLLDLQEINERRFKGLLKIEDGAYGNKGAWFVSYQDKGWNYPVGFHIWIRSARMLEHRHTRSWGYYIELVFAEEMGAKYNGIMSDEGISEKWKPEPGKYSSYSTWLDILYEHAKTDVPDLYKRVFKSELNLAPEILRDC